MGVSGQRHTPAALYPRERTPGIHLVGGWVGLRAGLDIEARGKIIFLCRGSNFVCRACSQTLYWLSYPSSHWVCWRSVSKVTGYSMDKQDSVYAKGQGPRSDGLWCPPITLYIQWATVLSPEGKERRNVWLTPHIHLVSRLIQRAWPPRPFTLYNVIIGCKTTFLPFRYCSKWIMCFWNYLLPYLSYISDD
jgi:hypothetical protein